MSGEHANVDDIGTEPSEILAAAQARSSKSLTTNIGTRRSALARVQTDLVETELKKAWPSSSFAIHAMATAGDKDQVTALHEMGAKSLWTHELEALLLTGDLDMIVHSLKDMPTHLPPTLTIGAILPRHDPRDALVLSPRLPGDTTLDTLPEGSLIGTSSVRRTAQLTRRNPHLRFANIRGNIGTRLSKLDAEDSPFAAIILAAAGLERMGWAHRITAYLDHGSAGSCMRWGKALGIEVREGDALVQEMVGVIGDERTTRECLAERSLMRTLEGGCSVPIGVETEWRKDDGRTERIRPVPPKEDSEMPVQQQRQGQDGDADAVEGDEDVLLMRASVTSLDGKEKVFAEMQRRITSRADADEFGRLVAAALVDEGAGKILEAINLNRRLIEEEEGGA